MHKAMYNVYTHTYIISHFKKMKLTHIHICRTFRMCESNYVTGKKSKADVNNTTSS